MRVNGALARENIAVNDARPVPCNIDGGEGRLRVRGARYAPDARTRSSARGPAKLHNGCESRTVGEQGPAKDHLYSLPG